MRTSQTSRDYIDFDALFGAGVSKTHSKEHSVYTGHDKVSGQANVTTDTKDGKHSDTSKTHRDGSASGSTKAHRSTYSRDHLLGLIYLEKQSHGDGQATSSESWHEHSTETHNVAGGGNATSKTHVSRMETGSSKGKTHNVTQFGGPPAPPPMLSMSYYSKHDVDFSRTSTSGSKATVSSTTTFAPNTTPSVTSNETDWTTGGGSSTNKHTQTTSYMGMPPTTTTWTDGFSNPVTTTQVVRPTMTSGGWYTLSGLFNSWAEGSAWAGTSAFVGSVFGTLRYVNDPRNWDDIAINMHNRWSAIATNYEQNTGYWFPVAYTAAVANDILGVTSATEAISGYSQADGHQLDEIERTQAVLFTVAAVASYGATALRVAGLSSLTVGQAASSLGRRVWAGPVGLADDLMRHSGNLIPKAGFTDVLIHATKNSFCVFKNGNWVNLSHRSVANFCDPMA